MRKHTDEELLEELKRVRDLLGRAPKQAELAQYSQYSANSYKRAFGGISKALIRIGEKPNIKLDYSLFDIHEEIRKVYTKIGRIPTVEDFNTHSKTSYGAFRKAAKGKTWFKLMIEAGLPLDEISNTNKRLITNEDLKNEVLRLKEKLGRYPTYYEMLRDGLFSCYSYSERFGSYVKAMHALGFTDYVNQSIYHNQNHIMGQDGIMYKSAFEANIADNLYGRLQNKQIKAYQYEKKVCPERTWTCDFFVETLSGKELWIEADGMAHNRKVPYGVGNEKIDYYIKHNIKYFVIKYRKRHTSVQLDEILKSA